MHANDEAFVECFFEKMERTLPPQQNLVNSDTNVTPAVVSCPNKWPVVQEGTKTLPVALTASYIED